MMAFRASVFAAAILAPLGAFADPEPVDGVATPEVRAEASVSNGVYMPWGLAARGDTQRAYVLLTGGYDSVAGGMVFDGAVQARVAGPVSLRGGFGYVGPEGNARPSVALSVDALRQSQHGIDLAIYAGFQGQGFNRVPALNAVVAVGRSFGRLHLLANVGYGYGLDQGEHYGEARLAATVRVHPAVAIGLDARARLDLERDADEPDNEPDWDLVAGPQATFSFSRFVVGVGGGLSALRLRSGTTTNVGAVAQLTLGTVF